MNWLLRERVGETWLVYEVLGWRLLEKELVIVLVYNCLLLLDLIPKPFFRFLSLWRCHCWKRMHLLWRHVMNSWIVIHLRGASSRQRLLYLIVWYRGRTTSHWNLNKSLRLFKTNSFLEFILFIILTMTATYSDQFLSACRVHLIKQTCTTTCRRIYQFLFLFPLLLPQQISLTFALWLRLLIVKFIVHNETSSCNVRCRSKQISFTLTRSLVV